MILLITWCEIAESLKISPNIISLKWLTVESKLRTVNLRINENSRMVSDEWSNGIWVVGKL